MSIVGAPDATACKSGSRHSASFSTISEDGTINLNGITGTSGEGAMDVHNQILCSGIDYLPSLPPPSGNLRADYRKRNNKYGRQNPVLNITTKGDAKVERQKSCLLHHNSACHHKAASLSMVKPWVDFHFSRPHDTAPHSTPHHTISSSSKESFMKQEVATNQSEENELSTGEEENFFSCTERNSNYARLVCAKKSAGHDHPKVAKKKRSMHTDEADSTCSSLWPVQKQTSQYLSPISFTRNCTTVEVAESVSNSGSQHTLSAIPLVPNPIVKLSAYQVNKGQSNVQINATPSSATSSSNFTKGCIERPLAVMLPSNSDLTSVSIVSIVSYHSSRISDDGKDSLCNGTLSSSQLSENLISSKQYLTTGSLLGEIMGYEGNGTVAAFLNGIPLISGLEENEISSNVVGTGSVVQSSGPLYSVQRLQYGHSTTSIDSDTNCGQQMRISSSRLSQSVEDISNICSHVSSSKSTFSESECKQNNSSSSMPKSKLVSSGSEPQIHTSDGKTFLPPELSDMDDKNGRVNNCTYTLVRKTIFNPTRYQMQQHQQHDYPYLLLASNSPSVSESSSRTLTTKQGPSSASLFTPAFDSHGNISGSVSLFPMETVKQKSKFASSMSCDSVSTDTFIQFPPFSNMEKHASVGTSECLNVNTLSNLQQHKMGEAAPKAAMYSERHLQQPGLSLQEAGLTKKSDSDHNKENKKKGSTKQLHTSKTATKPTKKHDTEAKANKTFKSRMMSVFHLFRN